jgi:peptidyl-prolyl cis-trans isomerase C
VQRVQKQFAIFFSLVLCAVSLAACGGGGAASKGDAGVAATVNGKPITLSEVDRIISQQTQGQQASLSTIDQAAARLQVLDELIKQQLLFQRAEKEKLLPTEQEIDSFVSQQKKALAIRKLQDKVFSKVSIRDQDISDFYNASKEQFVNARGVQLADIVVDAFDAGTTYKDDAKTETDAKAKIDRIHAQLKAGADFATVARANSEDPSMIRGGDIGFATEDDLRKTGFPQELIGRFFDQNAMQVGSFTDPIRFPDGRWIIFKLTNRQLANENLTLESPGVRDRIRESLSNQQKTIINEALVRDVMSDAQIVNGLATSMLNDPASLGGFRPAQSAAAGQTPSASPASSPAAAAASPAGGRK